MGFPPRKDGARGSALTLAVKRPTRSLKRKRSNNEGEDTLKKVVQSLRVRRGLPSPEGMENGSSPPQDSTPETSFLTSGDEAVSKTSATGVESNGSKMVSDIGSLLVKEDRTAEAVAAYKSASLILMEVANRDYYRQHYPQYLGLGGPAAYSTPYATGPINNYTTPYNNPGSANYVTPYANPPALPEASGPSLTNGTQSEEPQMLDHKDREEDHLIQSSIEGAEAITDRIYHDVRELKEMEKDDEAETMSLGLLDGFLALANGGVLPGKNVGFDVSDHGSDIDTVDDATVSAPPSPIPEIDEGYPHSDMEIQALVDIIVSDLIQSKDPPSQFPPQTPYAAFYSTMDEQQLASELMRLLATAQPEVNAVMPLAQIQAAHMFYTHLLSRSYTRIQQRVNAAHAAAAMNYWGPPAYPPPPPGFTYGPPLQHHGFMAHPPTLPSQPAAPTFVPRGNVIAPPVNRNVEEERKVAVYGFPPVPGRRHGLRAGGKRGRKRKL